MRSVLDYALPPEFWIASVNKFTRKERLAGVDVTI